MSTLRRRAIAFLSLRQISRMLALPDGVRAVACRDDFLRDGVAVLIEGDVLPPVEEGIELPRIDVRLLDRSELAMDADIFDSNPGDGRNLVVRCPLSCGWQDGWDGPGHTPTLAMLADVVQQHLREVHS